MFVQFRQYEFFTEDFNDISYRNGIFWLDDNIFCVQGWEDYVVRHIMNIVYKERLSYFKREYRRLTT